MVMLQKAEIPDAQCQFGLLQIKALLGHASPPQPPAVTPAAWAMGERRLAHVTMVQKGVGLRYFHIYNKASRARTWRHLQQNELLNMLCGTEDGLSGAVLAHPFSPLSRVSQRLYCGPCADASKV